VRVALISQVTPAVEGYTQLLRALGHEPVGVLCVRTTSRYTDFAAHVNAVSAQLDVVVPSRRESFVPLMRALEPDLAICLGFPWKLSAEMIAVPRLGTINTHPSLLPRYRGPVPVSWAVRNGETEVGMTIHWMDSELDTGGILAQEAIRLEGEHGWEALTPKLADVVGRLLPAALARVEAGDPGDPQDESLASYYSFFEPEYVEIDWGCTREEVARQVRAWSFGGTVTGQPGALTDLDGERVRVLRVSLEPGSGRAVECGDGTVWVLETEPVGEA
jgi:methionyl-tRNA formyltransferase